MGYVSTLGCDLKLNFQAHTHFSLSPELSLLFKALSEQTATRRKPEIMFGPIQL